MYSSRPWQLSCTNNLAKLPQAVIKHRAMRLGLKRVYDHMKIGNSAVVALVIALFTGLFTAFAEEPVLKSGLYRSNFDSSVRAQDDLFRHVNGKWLKATVIPADRPAAGAFMDLRDRSEEPARTNVED